MRVIAIVLGVAVAVALVRSTGAQQGGPPAIDQETVIVRLTNFAYAPERIRLKVGVATRLRLVNESNGGHDFSAPAFFASSGFSPGSKPPSDGSVAVGSHQAVELTVIPRSPGSYRLECTHFLHSIFGMHGTIEVAP